MIKNILIFIFVIGIVMYIELRAYAFKEGFDKKEDEKSGALEFKAPRDSFQLAIVRMKDVAAKSQAGKGIDEQLKKINESAKARLLPLEEKVKKASENVNADEIRTEEMQAALYDTIRTERYQISEAADHSIETLREYMKKAIANVASRMHLIVLDSEAVLFGATVRDITKEVVDELNKLCPNIEVKLDSGKK